MDTGDIGDYVIYTGCSDSQAQWGSCDDPRGRLVEGQEYRIQGVDTHTWHTKVNLMDVIGWFNSVCFEFSRESE